MGGPAPGRPPLSESETHLSTFFTPKITIIMALLNLSAAAEDYNAAPGNNLAVTIAVSVTTAAGVPVAGLVIGNFTLGSHFFPAGGGATNLTAFAAGPLVGTYTLRLNPAAGNWAAGVYLYDIRVINGADSNIIVTSVLLD